MTTLPAKISYIPCSHLDLFWLGDYRNCLRRGDELIREYLDCCVESGDETFVIDTAIFAEHFLATHPHYEPVMRSLIAEGRLDIGAAYIDRWENLVLGESLIRNIQIGRRWCREALGMDATMAGHPDLPGLNAQTAQIYSQAGIELYVTSRKLHQEGRIWRHVAPDGTRLTVLTWPQHYVFVPFDQADRPADIEPWGDQWTLDLDDVEGRYPLGEIAVSASAGDLTAPGDFLARQGRDIRDYVDMYRERFPEIEFGFSIPSVVAAPYVADPSIALREVSGSVPSVWGVAPDEEMRFFHRIRSLEHELLSAETASVLATLASRPALPESSATWRGLYGEDAFFAPDDLVQPGREWESLWRMHVFTQDHNGGGQDGVLSTFQKRVRHDRLRGYARSVVEHAFGDAGDVGPGGGEPVVLNPRLGQAWDRLVLAADEPAALLLAGRPGTQPVEDAWGRPALAVALDVPDGVGAAPARTVVPVGSVVAAQEDGEVSLESATVRLAVDTVSGDVTIEDKVRGQVWDSPFGLLRSLPELGNDVTLAVEEESATLPTLVEVSVVDAPADALCRQVRVLRRLTEVEWLTTYMVWADRPTVEVDVATRWPSLERQQIRMSVAPAARADAVHIGTPFHGSRWDDVPEQVRTFAPDEISMEDHARYREVQHWVRVDAGAGSLTIATAHPAFRLDEADGLEAVLLRTGPSCGDPRLMWENGGPQVWHFDVCLTGPSETVADSAELGDRAWRRPVLGVGDAVLDSAPDDRALVDAGDGVRLSALFVDEDGTPTARLVNVSAETARVELRGSLVDSAASAEVVDLQGATLPGGDLADGCFTYELPPWRIATLRLVRA